VSLPQLPPSGPIRVIAVAGTLALAAFLAAFVVLAVRRQWREAAWAATAFAAGLATSLVHRHAGWHVVLSTVTIALALRNAACVRGWPMALTLAGLIAWLAATVQAWLLFH
jgi:hypothetical protein